MEGLYWNWRKKSIHPKISAQRRAAGTPTDTCFPYEKPWDHLSMKILVLDERMNKSWPLFSSGGMTVQGEGRCYRY
jgi:hypothetical protein